MKKFYSMLTAAFIASAMTAFAVQPMQSKIAGKSISKAEMTISANQMSTVSRAKQDVSRVKHFGTRAEAATYDATDLTSPYQVDCYTGKNGWMTNLGVFQASDATKALFQGLFSNHVFEGTVDSKANTFTIPLLEKFDVNVQNQDGTSAVMQLMSAMVGFDATGNPYVDKTVSSFSFDIDYANRNLHWASSVDAEGYYENIFCLVPCDQVENGTWQGSSYGMAYVIDMNMANADMQYIQIGQDQSVDNNWETNYLYTEKVGETLVVRNFWGFGYEYPVAFQLQQATQADKDEMGNQNFEGAAIASNQIVAEIPTTTATEPLYLSHFTLNEAGEEVTEFSAEVAMAILKSQQQASDGTNMDIWVIQGSNLAPMPADGSIMSSGSSVLAYSVTGIFLSENPFGENAGIKDIAVENNANGPVEYYNLQGVKVNSPAAGGIYILRQGNKAQKVLVK